MYINNHVNGFLGIGTLETEKCKSVVDECLYQIRVLWYWLHCELLMTNVKYLGWWGRWHTCELCCTAVSAVLLFIIMFAFPWVDSEKLHDLSFLFLLFLFMPIMVGKSLNCVLRMWNTAQIKKRGWPHPFSWSVWVCWRPQLVCRVEGFWWL